MSAISNENVFVLVGCLIPSLYLAYSDATTRILGNKLTLPMMLLGFIFAAVFSGDFSSHLVGFTFIFTMMVILHMTGGMGGGDVKYAAALGIWSGYPNILYIILIACITGVGWGVYKLFKLGTLKERATTFARGLLITVGYGVKGALPIKKLPEDIDAELPEDAIPFGTFMAIAAWGVWIYQFI